MALFVDGIEYLTKEEAALRCFHFAEANPGSKFHNYAHSKCVRRPTTGAEKKDDFTNARLVRLEVTLHEWNKIFTDSPVLRAHPELKGMWRQRVVI